MTKGGYIYDVFCEEVVIQLPDHSSIWAQVVIELGCGLIRSSEEYVHDLQHPLAFRT